MKIHRHPPCPHPRKRIGGASSPFSGGKNCGVGFRSQKAGTGSDGKGRRSGIARLNSLHLIHLRAQPLLRLSGSVAGAARTLVKTPSSKRVPPPPGAKHTLWMPLIIRAVSSLESRLCILHSQSDHCKNCVYPTRDIAWAGRNKQTVTWSTFALICLWYVCFLVFSFSRSFLFPIFLWQTTVNRLTEHIRDWHTQRALLNDKKITPVAPYVLLSPLVITSPAHDVLPIVCIDYTYDSELDIADGVPQMRFDTARSSRRGTFLFVFSAGLPHCFYIMHC